MALGGAVGGAVLFRSTGHALTGAEPALNLSHHKTPALLTGRQAEIGTPFSVRMPVPPVLEPVARRHGVDYYRLPIRQAMAELLPGVQTPVLGFGGQFVGPTIRTRVGRKVRVAFRNQLADTHSNVHLHGGHVAPEHDGHPMAVIEPGRERQYEYPNNQEATTLWYHDHSHHTEAEHVYRGLHGFYLITDEDEEQLRLPEGQYDIPIMMCDARFDENGEMIFSPFDFDRPVILVNGRPQPYFPVHARKYRFRLLNASTHRVLTLNLGGVPITQIGSDGGLLPAPVQLTELTLGPAERADVVIDFGSCRPGDQLVLADLIGPVLRFDVTRRVHDHSRVPSRLRHMPPLARPSNARELTLSTDFVNILSLIDGKLFDATRVDARIRHGATETWKINNVDTDFGGVNHTFHLHLVQFRVLDRDGVPAGPAEAGWKDTVLIRPGRSVRVQATFRGFTGRYVYHCHMLEHSSFGMMAQMEIVR